MSTLYQVAVKGKVLAEDVNQIVKALTGVMGVPIRFDVLNDPNNWALVVRNLDPANGRGQLIQGPGGNTIFQADKNGVKMSPDGVVAASAPLTATSVATLTNKTIDGSQNTVQNLPNSAFNANTLNGNKLIDRTITAGKIAQGTIGTFELSQDAVAFKAPNQKECQFQFGTGGIVFPGGSSESDATRVTFPTPFAAINGVVAMVDKTTSGVIALQCKNFGLDGVDIWGERVDGSDETGGSTYGFYYLAWGS